MPELSRWWTAVLFGLCTLLLAGPSHAWIEKRITSSNTQIEIAPDGTAVVRCQLWLEVRGAPLKGWTLQGIDVDAVPLTDSTLTRMQGGVATSLPLAVKLQASAGTLDMQVPLRQGFRGRTFRFEFAYRTNLLGRGLIQDGPTRDRSQLSWVGPRFEDGVDSVGVVVRTRAAERAPETAPESEELGNYGIVMTTLRRSLQYDELELVRAHVARREAITWRILLDRQLFGGGAANRAEPLPALLPSALGVTPELTPARPRVDWPRHLPWMLAMGFLYAALVWLKARAVEQAAAARNGAARAWLALPTALRAPLAGVLVTLASAATFLQIHPTWAAAALLCAMACAAQRSPATRTEPRGPGQWRALDERAFARVPSPPLAGAWLDVGRWPGFALLMAALGADVAFSARLFATSPYLGASALLASSALLPLFCTGRARELPKDLLAESRRFLGRLERQLRAHPDLVVSRIGRYTAASDVLDELRLTVVPKQGRPGLLGLEVGLEQRANLSGFRAAPVLVVRVADGSASQRALPRGLTWTRGRSSEERAALVRPQLGSVASTREVLYELLGVLGSKDPAVASPARSNAHKSGGKALSTEKAGTRSSPAHAT